MQTEVRVTTTPQRLATLLGLSVQHSGQILWRGRMQNRGSSTVFRTRRKSTTFTNGVPDLSTAPDAATVQGWRHTSGNVREVTLFSDDVGADWVYTRDSTSILVFEEA